MKLFTAVVASVALLVCWTACGAPTIGYVETWSGAGTEGWAQSGSGGGLFGFSAGSGNPAGSLGMGFNSGSALPDSQSVFAQNSGNAANFLGNYQQYVAQGVVVSFDFYAQGFKPSTLELYFVDSGTGRTWTYGLDDSAVSVGAWTTFVVPIGAFGPNWSMTGPGSGSLAEFLTDLGNVTQIGIGLVRNNSTSQQLYGLDNFDVTLQVPEPETIWLLLAALLSMGVTFRGKVRGAMAWVKGGVGRA
jgi:hypothetical protein